MPPTAEILVFGSCFMDFIAYTERIPKPGETLTSNSFGKGFGGKGANQAVAAAYLARGTPVEVSMAACVGSDGDGAAYVRALNTAGVCTKRMRRLSDVATGLAMIAVDSRGHNAITICPNAAGRTGFIASEKSGTTSARKPEVFTASSLFGSLSSAAAAAKSPSSPPSSPAPATAPPGPPARRILICQNEIPLPATIAALKAAHERGYTTIFNSAPAPSAADVAALRTAMPFITIVCPNEHEATLMTGINVTDEATAAQAAAALHALGAQAVVITLGEKGALVSPRAAAVPVMVPGVRVAKVVDTTGAGDCFVGAMAFFLASGRDLVDASRRACACAAISVGRKGTQSSYPTREEVPPAVLGVAAPAKL